MELIKLYWYPIHIDDREKVRNGNSINVKEDTIEID
jgi:hypothetical protein